MKGTDKENAVKDSHMVCGSESAGFKSLISSLTSLPVFLRLKYEL